MTVSPLNIAKYEGTHLSTLPTPSMNLIGGKDLFSKIDSVYINRMRKLRDSLKYDVSVASICLAGNNGIQTKLESISSAGFKQVEIMTQDFENATPEEVSTLCKKLGLKVNIYQPFRDLEGLEECDFNEKLLKLDEFMDVADTLETDLILLCASCDENSSGDKELRIKQLREAADRAAKRGIRIAYEALAWSTHVRNLSQLCEIILAVNRDNFGLCVDSFHIFTTHSDINALSMMKDKIFFVQLNDAPVLNLNSILTYSRNYRLFPFQGDFDNVGLMKKVDEANYNGPLSLEVFNDSFRNLNDTKSLADDAFRSLFYLQCKMQGYLPEAPEIKGVITEDEGVIDTEDFNKISIIVSDKEKLLLRSKLFDYSANSITILEDSILEPSKLLRVRCKNRFEFNRFLLYLRSVLSFEILKDDELNVFNKFGLPLQLTFGANEDLLKICAIVNE